jgi:endoglucanase
MLLGSRLPQNSRRALPLAVAALLVFLALVLAAGAGSAAAQTRDPMAIAADAQQCSEPYPDQRDPSNPLALPVAPGADPLNGASFFVPGPAHGSAAGSIAQLLGLNPKTMPNDESWSDFEGQLQSGPLADQLAANPGLAHQVAELSKIASEPEAQRISIYSMGGGPGAIFKQTQKILCSNMAADPGTIPIFNTYFLHPALGGCASSGQIHAYDGTFHRRVNEMADAIDRRPAVVLLELDAIGSSSCMARRGAIKAWEADLRYEALAMQALPHTLVYLEGGYSDANTVKYAANLLKASGIQKIRGFFTNDTHEIWTINEVRWNTRIARLTHGAHFIVNTAQNGHGPLLNPHPVTQGVEDLCNPPGRGAGPRDTTNTGFPGADAWMWTSPPGNSSGCGGGPSGGTFWAARAIGLAARANGRLGPGFPSRPY